MSECPSTSCPFVIALITFVTITTIALACLVGYVIILTRKLKKLENILKVNEDIASVHDTTDQTQNFVPERNSCYTINKKKEKEYSQLLPPNGERRKQASRRPSDIDDMQKQFSIIMPDLEKRLTNKGNKSVQQNTKSGQTHIYEDMSNENQKRQYEDACYDKFLLNKAAVEDNRGGIEIVYRSRNNTLTNSDTLNMGNSGTFTTEADIIVTNTMTPIHPSNHRESETYSDFKVPTRRHK